MSSEHRESPSSNTQNSGGETNNPAKMVQTPPLPLKLEHSQDTSNKKQTSITTNDDSGEII